MTTEKKRSDGERLYLVVQHWGRRLRALDDAAGVSTARFSALASLAFHGVNNVGELAAQEGVSRPAMTRLVRDMERSGLVRRHDDPADARGVLVDITAKGRALLDRTRRAKIALVARMLDGMEPGEQRAIRMAIEALERDHGVA